MMKEKLSFFFFPLFIISHRVDHRREIILYIKDGITAEIIYKVPAGWEVAKIKRKYDENRDGFISGEEFEKMKLDLSFSALKGLTIYLQGRPVRLNITRIDFDGDLSLSSSLEITLKLFCDVWKAPLPSPLKTEISILERLYDHTHIRIKSDREIKGKISLGEEYWEATAERMKPLKIYMY